MFEKWVSTDTCRTPTHKFSKHCTLRVGMQLGSGGGRPPVASPLLHATAIACLLTGLQLNFVLSEGGGRGDRGSCMSTVGMQLQV